MIEIRDKRQMENRIYPLIWLGGTNQINTICRVFFYVSLLINNLLIFKLRSYGVNFRTYKGCYFARTPVVRFYIEIVNDMN